MARSSRRSWRRRSGSTASIRASPIRPRCRCPASARFNHPSPEEARAMGAMKEVSVPDIGDFKDVDVIEILVKPGDAVQSEQSLITLESDKATIEIPSPSAGVVRELRIKLGDKVSEGTPILMLEASEAAAAKAAAQPPAPAPGAPG